MGNSSQPATSLLEIQQAVCRIEPRQVLRIDSLRLRTGEHWCVYGGNGAGKTLLTRLLLGQLHSRSGVRNVAPGFDPRTQTALVSFEEQQRLWAFDERHDISEFSDEVKDSGTTVRRLVLGDTEAASDGLPVYRQLLADLRLTDLEARGIRYLSSGQLRRAMLARALLGTRDGRFRLVVLDEPLESIDRDSRQLIEQLLRTWMDHSTCTLQLCRRAGDILPGITHLAVMDRLQLVAHGPREQVQNDPQYRMLTTPRILAPANLPRSGARATFPPDSPPLIELREVTAAYGEQPVLNRVSWTMQPGHHTLIEGPNGCGKSTLLSLIDGDNHKAYGQPVYLFGRRRGSGETVWDIKAKFGVVSNELQNRYIRGWKVLDVVVSGFYDSVGLYDDGGDSQAVAARAWLTAIGIEALAGSFYHAISFGQQRLVLLARAMVKNPAVLILDEPCVGLDDFFRTAILGLVDEIARQTDTRIIFVSHTVGEEPACINQRLRFVPSAAGGFSLEVS